MTIVINFTIAVIELYRLILELFLQPPLLSISDDIEKALIGLNPAELRLTSNGESTNKHTDFD